MNASAQERIHRRGVAAALWGTGRRLRWRCDGALGVMAMLTATLVSLSITTPVSSANISNATRSSHPGTLTMSSSTTLALHVCHTEHGIAGIAPKHFSPTVKVRLSTTHPRNLAAYVDDQGIMMLVAPARWTCRALIGADGSSSVEISPAGQTSVNTSTLAPASTTQRISGFQTSACVVCGEAQACPLFENAAHDYRSTMRADCPTRAPSGESRRRISSTVVDFTDPPGVHGDGVPSGGRYPAVGAMTYVANDREPSWLETCVAPPALRSACSTSLVAFIAMYGRE